MILMVIKRNLKEKTPNWTNYATSHLEASSFSQSVKPRIEQQKRQKTFAFAFLSRINSVLSYQLLN
jgi:hypothetical protein